MKKIANINFYPFLIYAVIVIGFLKFFLYFSFLDQPLFKILSYQFSALPFAFTYPPQVGKDTFWSKRYWIKFGKEGEFKEFDRMAYDQINQHYIAKVQFLAGFANLIYRPSLKAIGYLDLANDFNRQLFCHYNDVTKGLGAPQSYDQIIMGYGFKFSDAKFFNISCVP